MAVSDESGSVTIPIDEHRRLKEDATFLACLRAAGVDNWPGYDYAIDLYEEEE